MNQPHRFLEFEVSKQQINKKRACDFSRIVAGTEGYLRAKFYFRPEEWKGCRKAASFWSGDQEYAALLDKNDICDIPAEALRGDRFFVSVTGVRQGYKIMTNKVKVKQEV